MLELLEKIGEILHKREIEVKLTHLGYYSRYPSDGENWLGPRMSEADARMLCALRAVGELNDLIKLFFSDPTLQERLKDKMAANFFLPHS